MLQKLIPQTRVAGFVANQGIKSARKQSVELFGYDFVNLIVTLSLFYVVALIISKYFEAVVLGKGIINDIASTFGFGLAFPENVHIRKLFVDGYGDSKLKYWDLIKGVSILLVIFEWHKHNETNKNLGGEMKMLSHGMFGLILSLLVMITIPELITRFREMNFLKVNQK